MNPKLFVCLFGAVLALPASALTPASAAAPAPAVPPKVDLRIDPSPVSEGKSPVVTSYADVLDPAQKGVVSIRSTRKVKERVQVNPLLRQFFGDQGPPDQEREGTETGAGSGVIVTSDGYILTNNHVVEGFDEIKVTLEDKREFDARVIGTDPKTDVAVIKVDATRLPAITLADSDKLRVGDIVFAVGNPFELEETVTMGIVSAKGRQVGILEDVQGYENFIQTDAAINLGNSGGALLDAKGRLVGINSAIISPSRGSIGIGFAIPVNLAATVMRSLIATGTVARGFLGVSTLNIDPEVAAQAGLPKDTSGAIVKEVTPKSPADLAGLQRSDIILGIDDKPVVDIESLHYVIGQMLPGAKITLKIVRDGKPMTVMATLASAAVNANELVHGVAATALTADVRRKLELDPGTEGVVITNVDKDSPYADRLEADMVIIEINRTKVTDMASAQKAIHPGRNLLFVYDHGTEAFTVINVK
ncbi:MAG TPA: Do family serine endopeptidase [Opitutaceae bacterium]|jgi:serine protease Do/serine protease DegQ|nr:Do family serine endopeptidase [Opitutaceae bacterium]